MYTPRPLHRGIRARPTGNDVTPAEKAVRRIDSTTDASDCAPDAPESRHRARSQVGRQRGFAVVVFSSEPPAHRAVAWAHDAAEAIARDELRIRVVRRSDDRGPPGSVLARMAPTPNHAVIRECARAVSCRDERSRRRERRPASGFDTEPHEPQHDGRGHEREDDGQSAVSGSHRSRTILDPKETVAHGDARGRTSRPRRPVGVRRDPLRLVHSRARRTFAWCFAPSSRMPRHDVAPPQ